MTETTKESVQFSIGEAAGLIGISIGLLRLWEREGLISPQRTAGGHRLYSSSDLERLRRIAYLRRVEGLNTAAIRRELGAVEYQESDRASENDVNMGLRLRVIRTNLGLSLAEVAERTGLSISFLSAVERGQSSISLGNLFKLADAYGTTVPGLSTDYQCERRSRLHPSERPRFVATGELVVIEDLITQPGALEAQRIDIQPGGGSDGSYAHPGEEFLYVLAGQVAFWIDEDEFYSLETGDSLYFSSTRLHRWRNEGESPATVLWINVPVVDGANRNRHVDKRHVAHRRK
jgi:DNA-binding transcriptional MerR regulator/quercetin dioxygenase-like cupin family protein